MNEFSSPATGDKATVALINNCPIYCDKNNLHDETQQFTSYIRDFKDIAITIDMLATRETARIIGAGNLFLPVEDGALKKLVSIFRDKGLLETLRAASAEEPENVGRILHWIATKATKTVDYLETKLLACEGLVSIDSSSVPDIAATQDWKTALVRCIAWHPHCSRLAVASRDDRIRIFSPDMKGIATLRHAEQKSVCSMSWRPNAGRELAAACHRGILIWTVELGAASNSLSHAVLLKQRNHAPVTSVEWNRVGSLLVSCSPNDSNMIIWNVEKEKSVQLKRIGGGGLCFSKWSLTDDNLFAATCRTVFRLWETGVGEPWSCEKWSVPSSRVAAACFGPETLLFTTTDDSASLFSVVMKDHIFNVKKRRLTDNSQSAVPLVNLSRVTFLNNDNDKEITVGGRVLSMDWDPSGSYLAILFQESPLVAIFKTVITDSSLTELIPGCLVKGFPNETPSCLQFHQYINSVNMIACLSIAWSSGRIQQFPIVEK